MEAKQLLKLIEGGLFTDLLKGKLNENEDSKPFCLPWLVNLDKSIFKHIIKLNINVFNDFICLYIYACKLTFINQIYKILNMNSISFI